MEKINVPKMRVIEAVDDREVHVDLSYGLLNNKEIISKLFSDS